MDVEFESNSEKFELVDYVIRDVDPEFPGEGREETPYLQARFIVKDYNFISSSDCVITYFGETGEFLGLDRAYLDKPKTMDLPSAISTSLDIPDGTARMLVTITMKRDHPFLVFTGGIAIILGLFLLLAWVIKTVISIFN